MRVRARVRVRRARAVLAQPTGRSLLVGMAIAACGEALRIWAAGHLNKAREVTASGPYRWSCRIRSTSGRRSWASAWRSPARSVLVAVLIAIYLVTTLTAAIKSEEAFLRRTFGDRYDQYRSGVAAKRRDRCRGAAAVQPRAGDRQPRAPGGRRVRRRAVAARLEGNV